MAPHHRSNVPSIPIGPRKLQKTQLVQFLSSPRADSSSTKNGKNPVGAVAVAGFGEQLIGTAAVSSLGSSKVANMSMESHVSAMAFEGTTGPDAAQAHSQSPNDGFIITIIVPSQVCGETLYPKVKSWNLSFPRFQRQRPSHCQKFHSTTSGLPNQQNTQSLPRDCNSPQRILRG